MGWPEREADSSDHAGNTWHMNALRADEHRIGSSDIEIPVVVAFRPSVLPMFLYESTFYQADEQPVRIYILKAETHQTVS